MAKNLNLHLTSLAELYGLFSQPHIHFKANIRYLGGRKFVIYKEGKIFKKFTFKHLLKEVNRQAKKAFIHKNSQELSLLPSLIFRLKKLDSHGEEAIKKKSCIVRICTRIRQVFGNIFFSKKKLFSLLEKMAMEIPLKKSILSMSQNFLKTPPKIPKIFIPEEENEQIDENDIRSNYEIALNFIEENNYEKAEPFLRNAARHGLTDAQYLLGVLLWDGSNISQNKQEACDLFQAAGEQEHREAQYRLATAYYLGEGRDKSRESAFKWYLSSAHLGYAHSQFSVGQMYIHADGTDLKKEEGIRWLKKASDQGLVSASEELQGMEMG